MPTIVFEVDLETPLRRSHVEPNTLRSEADNYQETRSTFIPNSLRNNRALKHGDTFSATGLEAVYLRDNYTTGDYACLTVVSTSL